MKQTKRWEKCNEFQLAGAAGLECSDPQQYDEINQLLIAGALCAACVSDALFKSRQSRDHLHMGRLGELVKQCDRDDAVMFPQLRDVFGAASGIA